MHHSSHSRYILYAYSFGGNDIGPDGAVAISSAIKELTSLQELE